MPNHVHTLFTPLQVANGDYHSIGEILRRVKGRSAREANIILNRGGEFWQHESYDHAVRDEAEFGRILAYIVDNPVKAGLANWAGDWPWTYVR
jgi:REP element-mobilizing transposase RayT